jgi:hypothetical protein
MEDECGVCGGDDSSCNDYTVSLEIQNVNLETGTLDIFMSNTEPVGGFQFELFGLGVTSASGGIADDLGFTMITSPNSVIGFSLAGTTIPVGEHVLVTISFIDYEGGTICFGTDNSCDQASPNVIGSANGDCLIT